MARGLLLHNPFNLEKSASKWQGLVTPGSDTTFCEFNSDLMGLRAGFKNLLTQQSEGFNTIKSIFNKYAPSAENDTFAYIRDICADLGVASDTPLDLDDYKTLKTLGIGVIKHEQGSCPFSDSLINQALNLAGVYNVPKPNIAFQPEAHIAAGGVTLASLSTISAIGPNIAPVVPLAQDILHYAPWLIAVLACGGCIYGLYLLYRKHTTGAY